MLLYIKHLGFTKATQGLINQKVSNPHLLQHSVALKLEYFKICYWCHFWITYGFSQEVQYWRCVFSHWIFCHFWQHLILCVLIFVVYFKPVCGTLLELLLVIYWTYIYSFNTQQIFTAFLLCVKHGSRHLGCKDV